MGGQSNRTVEGKKEGSRKAQRKLNMERENKNREVGIDRRMIFEFLECNVLSWRRMATMQFSVIETCAW